MEGIYEASEQLLKTQTSRLRPELAHGSGSPFFRIMTPYTTIGEYADLIGFDGIVSYHSP
jgi:hypothetical protein